jgi:hypothetical protein
MRANQSDTEIARVPNRGHALTIDDGWQDVAQASLNFVKQYA